MKLEDQVCSLELSKRLDQLGIKRKSYFEYLFFPHVYKWEISQVFKNQLGISAFTVAELGEILSTQKGFFDSGFRAVGLNDWNCRYFEGTTIHDLVHHSFGENEADARAKMLIYLIENDLLKIMEK